MILNGKYHLQGEVAAPSGFGDDMSGGFGGAAHSNDNEEMADALLSHAQAWWWENRNPKNEQWKAWGKMVSAANILDGLGHDAPLGPTFRESTVGNCIEVGNQVDNDYGTDDPFPCTVLEVNDNQVSIQCEQGDIAIPKSKLSDFYESYEDRQAALAERLPLFQEAYENSYNELLDSKESGAKYKLEHAILDECFEELDTDYDADQESETLDYDIQSLFAGILYFADPETVEQENAELALGLKEKILELNTLYDKIGFPEKITITDHGH